MNSMHHVAAFTSASTEEICDREDSSRLPLSDAFGTIVHQGMYFDKMIFWYTM